MQHASVLASVTAACLLPPPCLGVMSTERRTERREWFGWVGDATDTISCLNLMRDLDKARVPVGEKNEPKEKHTSFPPSDGRLHRYLYVCNHGSMI
jgi:hypothetical protein